MSCDRVQPTSYTRSRPHSIASIYAKHQEKSIVPLHPQNLPRASYTGIFTFSLLRLNHADYPRIAERQRTSAQEWMRHPPMKRQLGPHPPHDQRHPPPVSQMSPATHHPLISKSEMASLHSLAAAWKMNIDHFPRDG